MKHLMTLFILIFLCVGVDAQKINHGIGVHISVSEYKKTTNTFLCIAYSPRTNVFEQKDFSVSLGIPLTVGGLLQIPVGGNFMSDGEDSDEDLWLISVPLLANLNWGAGSSGDSKKKIGYFVGGGAGYLYDGGSMYYDDKKISGIAASIQSGIRIALGDNRRKNLELKLSYLLPLSQSDIPHYGLGALFKL